MKRQSRISRISTRTAAWIRLATIRIKSFAAYCTTGVWSDTRRTWRVNTIKTINLTVRSFLNTDLQNRASALTYNTLLAIVPALALLFAIGRGFGFENLLQTQLFQALPSQKHALEAGIDFVSGYMTQASQGVFVGVGIVVLLWTMISLMSNIEDTFNTVWGVTRARSFGRKVIDYTAIMFLLPVLMICSSGISVMVSYALVDNPRLHFISPAVKMALDVAPFVLTWMSFTGMYLAFPNTKVKFKNAFLSGVFAGTAFQILQYLFLSGQIYVSKYNAIYGSFAFLPLLLIWLQLVWTITLSGAVLCYSSQNIFQFNFSHDISTISLDYKRKIAVVIMTIIVKRFDKGLGPFTVTDFAANYHMPSRLVTQLIDEMVAARLLSPVVISEDTYGYQPAVDPSKVTLGMVLGRLNAQGADDFIPNFQEEFADIIRIIDLNLRQTISKCDETLLLDLPFQSLNKR
ncbi:YihY/virulence factor BrkB family protein [uncultured Muribaculum sp.]|uniref:YihY/virulence factor BrkB family protein n=1 Tax=uncultured Muribaculum sp. TaxID=1918613 RepID=UPI0025D09A23|nr:YihY/virulence factor BrkB family protein [uncultured Muribaculum sp.]